MPPIPRSDSAIGRPLSQASIRPTSCNLWTRPPVELLIDLTRLGRMRSCTKTAQSSLHARICRMTCSNSVASLPDRGRELYGIVSSALNRRTGLRLRDGRASRGLGIELALGMVTPIPRPAPGRLAGVQARCPRTIDGRTTDAESICPYCGVGCRLWVESAYGEIIRVKGVADAPANLGGICAKGATLPPGDQHARPAHAAPDPRRPRRPTSGRSTWKAALDGPGRAVPRDHRRARARLGRLLRQRPARQRGGLRRGKLFKGSIGTNNTDSNSRLCMAAAVAGYRTSLGADGPPPCYADIDHADCIVVWGSNMAEAHPVTFDRVKARRKADPGVELIVVDPRRTADRRARHAARPGRPRRRHRPDERRRPAPARARGGRRGLRRGPHRGLRRRIASSCCEQRLGRAASRPRACPRR